MRNLHRKPGVPGSGYSSDPDHDENGSHTSHAKLKGGDSVSSSNRGGNDSALKAMKGDSTRRLIKDIRDTAYSASNFEFAGLLEDEDDCSYLEGSDKYNEKYAHKLHAQHQHPKFDDVEMKKEQTIEQIYWPFHRFYDINGHRRIKAKECYRCGHHPCTCNGVSSLIKAWNIPEFTPPLSDRKDGGLMMDTTGMKTPMVFHGKQGDMQYDGKIYYMGIIDILQQYNARKRVETTYRKVEVRGQAEPSCVSPDDYARRFVCFFDEYTRAAGTSNKSTDQEGEETEIEIAPQPGTSVIQVSVSSSDRSGGKRDNANGSFSESARVTPADGLKEEDTNGVSGLKSRPTPFEVGQKPKGRHVVT
jgi:hypothetical protein